MNPDHVAVRIFGEVYPLKTSEDAAYVQEVAHFVDTRMREVAAAGKVVTTTKIAVLTALHIADELLRLRRESGGSAAEERISRLADDLERILELPGPESSNREVSA